MRQAGSIIVLIAQGCQRGSAAAGATAAAAAAAATPPAASMWQAGTAIMIITSCFIISLWQLHCRTTLLWLLMRSCSGHKVCTASASAADASRAEAIC